jgi:putative nucleotidyltransferase with HDIG domain
MYRVSPYQQVGRAAHCRRVAAYCDEIAGNMKLPARDRALVRQLAMRHHTMPRAFGAQAAERVGADLGLKVIVSEHPGTVFDQLAMAFSCDGEYAPGLKQLAALVDVADDLDTEIEFLAYGDVPGGDALRDAAKDLFEHPALGALLPEFCRYSRPQLALLAPELPVFPAAALKVLRAARSNPLCSTQIVDLAMTDPVLAGSLLSAANAAAYTWSGTVRNVQAAVMYLGDIRAAAVLLAAALKPVMCPSGDQELWLHSLAAASAAEQLARLSDHINPNEAYTVALVHDVGKLLMQLAPPDVSAARQRLIRNGCAAAVAEVLTCGATHAEAGADVLRHWALPPEYIEAVEFHHEPEHTRSSFAALLYLAEQCTGGEEDLPSAVRTTHALDVAGVTAEDVANITASRLLP